MNSNSRTSNLYEFAGIDDLAEFYRLRYASSEILDDEYFDAVNRFDIRWSRTMWIYDNVRRGSTVLDLGCGAGLLALLKRKQVTITGLDISRDCASVARGNGYTAACAGELTALPYADRSFDYVVSLDVMGHIEFDQKDAVLAEIKRVLRPGGVTLHGVECMNREQQKDYHQMSETELRNFVSIDGHVGMEDEPANVTRFGRFFKHVQTQPRYSVCLPCEELIKLADEYGLPRCDKDFLDYLRGLSFNERHAFNMAMGYVFERISNYGIKMPASGYLLVKASDEPLGSFYKEHLDRHDLFPDTIEFDGNKSICLDRSTRAVFTGDWYAAENLPPVARWMGKRAQVSFKSVPFSTFRCDIATHIPDIMSRPLGLEFFLNGERLVACLLIRPGWIEMTIDVSHLAASSGSPTCYTLEICADRIWQPYSTNPQSNDDRELSIAVANIEIASY